MRIFQSAIPDRKVATTLGRSKVFATLWGKTGEDICYTWLLTRKFSHWGLGKWLRIIRQFMGGGAGESGSTVCKEIESFHYTRIVGGGRQNK